MPTNDEIIDKEDERLGREKEEDNRFGYQSVNRMLNEARADTAKQIFAVIDKYEITKYKPNSHGIAWLPYDEYQALKHKYKVD